MVLRLIRKRTGFRKIAGTMYDLEIAGCMVESCEVRSVI